MKKILLTLAVFAAAIQAQAAIIQFDLLGKAGPGLLPGNEPGTITGGTGQEKGAGIFFDNVALTLTINVGWGSSQGFTDLSSASTASHVHGPTASNNGNGFTETAGIPTGFSLTRSSNLATGGTIAQTLTLTAAQAVDLFNGKDYLNIHTANNGGGEIRGFLIQAPEPSAGLLAALGAVGFLARRRQCVA